MMDWTVKHHTNIHGTRYKVQHKEAKKLKGELEKGRKRIEAWLNEDTDTKVKPTDDSVNAREPSKEYIPKNDPLDAFLSKYLEHECLQLDGCESVRNVEGYNVLNAHQQGQAVMTRILKAFSMLFEKLNIKWIPAAGTWCSSTRVGLWRSLEKAKSFD